MEASVGDFLTPGQIAEKEEVSAATVNRWIYMGVQHQGHSIRLKAQKVGGRWRIKPEDLDQFKQALQPTFSAPSRETTSARLPVEKEKKALAKTVHRLRKASQSPGARRPNSC